MSDHGDGDDGGGDHGDGDDGDGGGDDDSDCGNFFDGNS